MTERHYQLMARSAGAQLLRSQGSQIFTPTPYADTRAADPYCAQGGHLNSPYAQNPAQIGGRSNYYLPSDSHDIRAQLISERRSSLPGAYLDPTQAYTDPADPRALSVRPGMAEVLPYPSPQPAGQQSGAAAFGSNELLRARRAEIAAAYGHGHAPAGGRMGRVGNLDDPVMSKEGIVSSGACLTGPRRLAGSSYEGQDLPMARVGTGHHGVLGSIAGARQGRDLERYLLAVQPDKLVRYAAACLSPEPAIKRARYAMMANNVAPPPEVDVYSNYRQAKLRRGGPLETKGRSDSRTDRPGARPLVTSSGSGARREREKEPIRERRRKSDDRVRVNEKKIDVPKSDEGNRVDQPHNSSQSSEGGDRSSEGKQGPQRPAVQGQKLQETGQKEDDHIDSDKDSELGSLDADLSDFEDEKSRKIKTKKKVSEEPEAVIDAPLDGMIFGCSSVTFYECMRLQLFGLPTKNKDEVMRVAPGTKLFLFNFDTKELSGVFEAISHGGLMIQPDAFREFGAFPAQVEVCCVEQCPNVHLNDFKPVIKDNFVNSFKFKFTLNSTQVRDLIRLFRRAAKFQNQQLHQRPQGGLVQRYIHGPIPSEDYVLRNSPRRRQTYAQHPQASFGMSSILSARVMPLSTKSQVPESEEPSRKKARRGRRKKRKVEKPKSPKADNCSLLNQPVEMGEADVARNASKTLEADDISKTNLSVVVREVIVTDSSQNLCQHKEIVEALDTIPDSKGRDPPVPDHEIDNSKPGEFTGLQSDHEDCDGKQVSLVEDSSNGGKCGLAGERSEEQGKGLNVLKGALDNREYVITKSSDSAPPSSGVHEVLSTSETPQLSVNMGSPPKDDLPASVEDQIVEILELSRVVMSDESLDVEETEKTENSTASGKASLWNEEALESPTEGSRHLLVDDHEEEEDEENVCENPINVTKAMETSTGDSRYTITEVSDSDRTYDQKGEEGMKEQMGTCSSCKEGHIEAPMSQTVELCEISDQREGSDEQSCKLTNPEITSNKDDSDIHPPSDVIYDNVSLLPEVAETEEMVDIVDEDVVKVMEVGDSDVPNVEDVEMVTEVGDAVKGEILKSGNDKALEEVDVVKGEIVGSGNEKALDVVHVVKGEIFESGNKEALEVVNDFVDCKPLAFRFPEAVEEEDDMMGDDSSSEFPQTSESDGGEEEVVGSGDEVSSENPEETEVEDEEQEVEVEAFENVSACGSPQPDEQHVVVGAIAKNVSFQVSEALEDGDGADTDDEDLDSEDGSQNVETVDHEGEVDEFERRCGCNESIESESDDDLPDNCAEAEQRFVCKLTHSLNLMGNRDAPNN